MVPPALAAGNEGPAAVPETAVETGSAGETEAAGPAEEADPAAVPEKAAETAEEPAPQAAAPSAEEGSAASETADAESAPFSGAGTDFDPYLLASADDFVTLASLVNGGEAFAGSTFRMTDDVALPAGWTPVGALAPGAESGDSGKDIC